MSPRPEEKFMREGVVKRIQNVVKQLWPDAQVSYFLLNTFSKYSSDKVRHCFIVKVHQATKNEVNTRNTRHTKRLKNRSIDQIDSGMAVGLKKFVLQLHSSGFSPSLW